MSHPFPVKEISRQAGLSTATVDRVLNNRPGVRRQTANRVLAAIRELEEQEAQLSMSGRKLIVDLLVEAPQAFVNELQDAVLRELPIIQTAIFRVRSDLRAHFPVEAIVDALERAARLKSDGVIVMAPDVAPIRSAIDTLAEAGVPVVTLATDMPATRRSAYVGLDNWRAGETAAWLVRNWAKPNDAEDVLITMRNEAFRGETDREAGFRAAIAELWPEARVTLMVEGEKDPTFSGQVADAVRNLPVGALYSIGGRNRAIVNAIERSGLSRPLMIGHDLDQENKALLAENRLDAVLYHDLAEDFRHACQTFMSFHSNGAIEMPAEGAILRVALPPMVRKALGGAK